MNSLILVVAIMILEKFLSLLEPFWTTKKVLNMKVKKYRVITHYKIRFQNKTNKMLVE